MKNTPTKLYDDLSLLSNPGSKERPEEVERHTKEILQMLDKTELNQLQQLSNNYQRV